jgi:hypothetical protein
MLAHTLFHIMVFLKPTLGEESLGIWEYSGIVMELKRGTAHISALRKICRFESLPSWRNGVWKTGLRYHTGA